MELNTQRYINVNELKSKILNLQEEFFTTQAKLASIIANREQAKSDDFENVVEACESTRISLQDDETDIANEILKLKELLADIETYNCLEDPEVVNEEYFETHMRDTAMDIHGVDIDAFPFCYIDWERACENMTQQDYKSIDFDGETFWVKVA